MFKKTKLVLFLLAVLSCLTVTPGVGSADLAALQQAMPKRLERPYLHFTKQQLLAIRERVKTEPRAKEAYQRLLKECNRIMDMPVPREVPQRFRGINPYFDGQDAFGKHRHELSENAYRLAFIYQMTGDDAYARKSYEFADALCALDSWADTWDKFEWLYWMGKPYGAKWNEEEDNEIVYSYELGAAGTTRQMAATYDWLYPVLDKYQRKRLANGLLENAILRVRGNYDYHWWAHGWRTNWLPVCFSGVGLAALALYPEDPQLLDVVEETRARITRYLEESVGDEGGYQEGVGYWRYGMENAILFASALKHVSGGKINMFEHPKMRAGIQFPLYTFTPPRGGVPFGDAREPLQGSFELYNKLAEELNSPEARWLAQFFYSLDAARQGELDLFAIIWPETRVKPAPPDPSKPMSMHFRNIDWLMLRASWNDVDVPFMAAKGGIHDDPHHGHLDSGQFAIKYRDQWYVKELGYMSPYGFGYWDYRRRFKENIHANSLGHNVIFVNGELQEYGPQFYSKVTTFVSSPEQDYAVIDASKAYPGKELKEWRRHIVFKKPYLFILLDEVGSPQDAEIAFRVHTGVPFSLKQGYTLLSGEKGAIAMLTLAPKQSTYKEDRHAYLAEQRDAQFTWIPYYDLITKASGTQTYLVNVFVPVENENEAEQILKSSRVAVERNIVQCTLQYKDKSYTTTFDLAR